MRIHSLIISIAFTTLPLIAQNKQVYPGADERTPSRAQYSSWLNNTNEVATEEQTLINLDFFRWLHDYYGMQLDIYAFDAGLIDGKRFYGTMESQRFKAKFPSGFHSVYQKAKAMNTHLGIWGGPDGFGNSPQDAEARKEMMISLCRDYEFELFKMDGVCGPLRKDKDGDLADMLAQCRRYSPNLILLNHRLDLGKAMPHATTYLWDGRETYVDVFTQNSTTAAHNRAGTLSIGLTPNMERLVEDCGVCLSSCLDHWDDEMVLQGFNRSLILAPEMYGNPWLLSDPEFAKLARLYNLHRQYAPLLVKGMQLPASYGEYAVSRGDDQTRLITLRNLSWETKKYTLTLHQEIGLNRGKQVHLRIYHPTEKIVGNFNYGEKVDVEIPPFQTMLLLASTRKTSQKEVGIEGVDYEIVRDVADAPVEIRLLGMPGSDATIRLPQGVTYKRALLDGQNVSNEIRTGLDIHFPGDALQLPHHRHIGTALSVPVTDEVASLYEATVFAADNNALEVRSLHRSGATSIPEVKAARHSFFQQPAFVGRGIWDKNLFDGDMSTGFWPSRKYGMDQRVKGGCFRLDLGEELLVDSIVFRIKDMYSLEPFLTDEGNFAEVSSDLKSWERLLFISGLNMRILVNRPMRYLKMCPSPEAIAEIEVYVEGRKWNSDLFRASNLFADSRRMKCEALWTYSFTLPEVADGSYLSIALNGEHGVEGAYAALKVDGQLVGSPSRATSYPSNTWEYVNCTSDANYTYYIPLTEDMVNKKIEVFVMGYNKEKINFVPEIWISSYHPFQTKTLILER